jgi:cytochrome c
MRSRQSVGPGLFLSLMLSALLGASPASHAAGDPTRGADEFAQDCAVCHSAKEGRNKIGPSLFAVVGRKAGSMADFAYSDSMKQSAIEWDPDRLDAFIKNPKQVVPGSKMPFGGISEEKERADIIAYLNTLR